MQGRQHPNAPQQVDRDADHRILQPGLQAASRQYPGRQHVAPQADQQMGENRIRAPERRPIKVKLESPTLTGNLRTFTRPEKTVWVPLQARIKVITRRRPTAASRAEKRPADRLCRPVRVGRWRTGCLVETLVPFSQDQESKQAQKSAVAVAPQEVNQ